LKLVIPALLLAGALVVHFLVSAKAAPLPHPERPLPPDRVQHILQDEVMTQAVIQQLWVASDEAWHSGNYADAIAIEHNIVALDPTDTEAWETMAWLAWTEYGDAEAVRILQEGISVLPDQYDLYEALGVQHFRLKRYVEAEAQFRKAIQFADAPLSSYKLLAYTLEKEGRLKAAYQVWKTIQQRFPEAPALDFNLERLQRLLKQEDASR